MVRNVTAGAFGGLKQVRTRRTLAQYEAIAFAPCRRAMVVASALENSELCVLDSFAPDGMPAQSKLKGAKHYPSRDN